MTSLRAPCLLVVGIQGPVIAAKAGDKVVVHFKNLASQPYSISPVGITYWKQSEGSERSDFHSFAPSHTQHYSVASCSSKVSILTQSRFQVHVTA